jgi:thiosulfate/3-mercaptopyruvate sulfurtransferase
MESSIGKVFIETTELADLIKKKETGAEDIRIFNVTLYANIEDGDPILDHKKKRIPGSEYLDLRYLRDMSKPYQNMMPTEKHFIDLMKQRSIKKSTKVVIYDTKPGQTNYATRVYFMFDVMGH